MKRLLLLICTLCFCFSALGEGQIHLYGERHGDEALLKRELTLWQNAYAQGQRHLFLELPYYTAQYLNQWMASPSDALLEAVYQDWAGTASYQPQVKSFYQAIKSACPETVFHGVDVGHQYHTTGRRYLAESKPGSPDYLAAQACIRQGEIYYQTGDGQYRENCLAENLIAAQEPLGGEAVTGIFGSAHTNPGQVGSLAHQLWAHYGSRLQCTDLTALPLSTQTLDFMGASCTASYFGRQDLSAFLPQYSHREFYRLENTYELCRHLPLTGNVLPYGNYPMPIEKGQVFLIVMTLQDGSQQYEYHRSDGHLWQNQPVTSQFLLP